MILRYNSFVKEGNYVINKAVLFYAAFDFDDNILNMLSEIMVLCEDGEEVGMRTSDFAKYRSIIGKENFKYNGHVVVGIDYSKAFRNFRDAEDPNIFKKDITKALRMRSYGPAWDDFIECLTNGSIFAIITARGHESDNMKEGIEVIIDNLSKAEKIKMQDSLLMFLQLYKQPKHIEDSYESLHNFSKSILVQNYLKLCHFVGVSAPSRSSAGVFGNPEIAKENALKDFIRDVNDYASHIGFTAKVGFSDDDIGNVSHMSNVLTSDELDHEKMWSSVEEIVIKNTNKPGNILKTNIITKKLESVRTGLESSVMPYSQFNNMNDRLFTNNKEQDKSFRLASTQLAKTAKEVGKPVRKRKRVKKKTLKR